MLWCCHDHHGYVDGMGLTMKSEYQTGGAIHFHDDFRESIESVVIYHVVNSDAMPDEFFLERSDRGV